MEPVDDELVARFRRGDDSAFELLVARWDERLLALAWRLLGDAEEARDVRQMAWIRIARGLEHFDGAARVSTWMHAVVLNLCRDRRRADAARQDALTRLAESNGSPPPPRTPSRLCAERELLERVGESVLALPLPVREVVVLRHYHDLAFPEIARLLDAPVTTVKSRMAKGLALLRARLAPSDVTRT